MSLKNTRSDRIVFVTGLSGAGLSSALDALEDLGYEVFDNFPVQLVDQLLKCDEPQEKPIAIGFDTRTRGFDIDGIIRLSKEYEAILITLICDDAVLQNRFALTRRRHPLAKDRPVSAGIKKETTLLHPLRAAADILIDTTDLSIHDLKRVIQGHFKTDASGGLNLTLMSFGFKHGLPREADMVFDARFLRNPHWEVTLKDQTGLDAPVQKYIKADEDFTNFIENIKTLLGPLLPRYQKEGKSYLTIAIGCTGGHHRSVYIAELLAKWINKMEFAANTHHRDLER